MRQLFVDTSAYFALTDRRDENHEAAVHFIHQIIRERVEFLTTTYIVAETHTLLLNRIGYTTARQVIEELYKSQTRIYRVREAEERKALEIIRMYSDKEFSLVGLLLCLNRDLLYPSWLVLGVCRLRSIGLFTLIMVYSEVELFNANSSKLIRG